MGKLDTVISVIGKIKSADISVYPFRCVAVRNHNAGCRRCAAACTSGAISVEDNVLSVDASKCIGCGTCATMCPTCALEALRPNDAELASAVAFAAEHNGKVAVIACRRMVEAAANLIDSERIVGVECLGRVEESLLLGCAVQGVSRVMLVEGGCEDCDHAVGLETIKAVTKTAQNLLDVWGSSMTVELVRRLPSSIRSSKKDYDEAKRRFFFQTRDAAKYAAFAAADEVIHDSSDAGGDESPRYIKVMDDGTLPHFIPDRRERLLDHLAELGFPLDELIETRLWGHVMVDLQKCSSCRMCATFCPTGAIVKFDDEDGTMGIEHYPCDCVKCRCCEDICPTGALRLSDEVFAVDLVDGMMERIEMKRPDIDQKDPHKILLSMQKLIKCDQVYER